MCIGCGLCVLGCSASVYAFDYEKKRPVVIAPLKCKVGCITCANTCPMHAIGFPPLSYLHRIIRKRGVLTTSRKELKDNREQISYQE